MRLTDSQITSRLHEGIGNEYCFVTRVNKRIVKVKHTRCGNTFTANLSDLFLGKTGCKLCSCSIGESLVREVLIDKGLVFKEQVKFCGLIDTTSLTYDFYVPSTHTLIEYQGEQHYKPVNFGSSSIEHIEERFKKQVYHDKLKRKYAKDNNISLIEVPYTCNTKGKVREYIENNSSL